MACMLLQTIQGLAHQNTALQHSWWSENPYSQAVCFRQYFFAKINVTGALTSPTWLKSTV